MKTIKQYLKTTFLVTLGFALAQSAFAISNEEAAFADLANESPESTIVVGTEGTILHLLPR